MEEIKLNLAQQIMRQLGMGRFFTPRQAEMATPKIRKPLTEEQVAANKKYSDEVFTWNADIDMKRKEKYPNK